ncbi:MAG: D-glycero-beta-D-manno-heptose 1-phosphate adenylyltransferase [Bacteroidota bacterium]
MGQVVSRAELVEARKQCKLQRKKVVFTNGCFDILHRGHIDYLQKAKALGDVLVVGVNTDDSVKRVKGEKRPIVAEGDRTTILAAFACVDYVCLFDEDAPYELLQAILPDVLVKGADWPLEKVVGKDIIEAAGGSVRTIELLPHRSTSQIIKTIVERFTS